ncbi:MAG: (Fe-S)-binding protein [Bacteroidales bacterium]|nr:(Fe-S)-binding protein [Bacteroidales bacterium]
MRYPTFTLPFTIGLSFVLLYILVIWTIWIVRLSRREQKIVWKRLFTLRTIKAIWESFREGLLHHNIYKKNAVLGFMHMGLAFGWFMLIVLGNFEARLYPHGVINPPYYPIFFEFFRHDLTPLHEYEEIFTFLMDFFLLLVMTSIGLAFFKRFRSRALGMRRTTKHILIDRVAITALWFIFPLRLFAESVTAGLYNTGHFFTNFLGQWVIYNLPLDYLYYPAWWAYSISLGVFFIALPFSRYMHIPTEILLIFLRKYGVKEKNNHSTFTTIELNACSRCGICIDACQLSTTLNISDTQPAYFLRDLRYSKPNERLRETCMLCMRCLDACPVGIEVTQIRKNERNEFPLFGTSNYDYLSEHKYPKAKVAYFAGCMGHLTPSVIKSTLALFDEAGVDYTFIDKDGSICCGRPLQQNGQVDAAKQLIDKNNTIINETNADVLVTSCPICASEFKHNYRLNMPVLHHSQFLNDLAKQHKLTFKNTGEKIIYHDPCELSRGLGITKEPRELLKNSFILEENKKNTGEKSLCCGGSLGITNTSLPQKMAIASDAVFQLYDGKTNLLATACPMCKKTLAMAQETVKVLDIAEVMLNNLEPKKKKVQSQKEPAEAEVLS